MDPEDLLYRVHKSSPIVPVMRQTNSVYSLPSFFVKINVSIIFHRRLRIPSGIFPSGFTTEILYALLLLPIHATWFAYLILIDWMAPVIFHEEKQIVKLVILQFPLIPCYLFRVRPKYLPQHPILEHPQSLFLPQSERPRLHFIIHFTKNINLYSGMFLKTCYYTPLKDTESGAVVANH
jgi:hypothetical protein